MTVDRPPLVPPREPVLTWRRDGTEFAVTTVVVVLLGPVAGLVWAAVAPRLDLVGVLRGSEAPYRAEVGADFRFLVVGIVAGALCAAAAGALRRHGPGVAAGLAVGGIAAAFVADRVGYLAARGDTLETLHRLGVSARLLESFGVNPFVELRALGVAVAWPLAAVLLHALALGIRSRRER